MAKNDPKNGNAEDSKKVTVTAENVVEQIKSGNKFEVGIADEAIAKIAKDNKNRKVEELAAAINKADFDEKSCLLGLRKNRALETPTKARLKALDEAIEKLKNGKITPIEYDKERERIKEEHRKAVDSINKEYEEYNRELRNSYPRYRGWDWL